MHFYFVGQIRSVKFVALAVIPIVVEQVEVDNFYEDVMIIIMYTTPRRMLTKKFTVFFFILNKIYAKCLSDLAWQNNA